MYRCSIYGTDKINQYEELIKVFLQPGEYEISGVAEVPDDLPAKVSAEAPAKDTAGDTEKKTFFGVLQQAVAKIAEVESSRYRTWRPSVSLTAIRMR